MSRKNASRKDKRTQKSEEKQTKDSSTSPEVAGCEDCFYNTEKMNNANEEMLQNQNKTVMLEKKLVKSDKRLEEAKKKEKELLKDKEGLDDQIKTKDEHLKVLERRCAAQKTELKKMIQLKKEIQEMEKKEAENRKTLAAKKDNSENLELNWNRKSTQLSNEIKSENSRISALENNLERLFLKRDAIEELKQLELELENEREETKRLVDVKIGLADGNQLMEKTIQELKNSMQSGSYPQYAPFQSKNPSEVPSVVVSKSDKVPQESRFSSQQSSSGSLPRNQSVQDVSAPRSATAVQLKEARPLGAPEEIEDKQCLICLEEMLNLNNTMKCFNCRRRFHSHCLRRWFQEKRTCPTCYELFLDDVEFPGL